MGWRGLILGLRGLSYGPERTDYEPERGLRGGIDGRTDVRTDGRTDGRTYGRLEIHPCVLQDIGPLGPLPKKFEQHNEKINTELNATE